MDSLIFENPHHLREHLAVKQAYIRQVDILLESRKNSRHDFLIRLKEKYNYPEHIQIDWEALAEGRF